MVDIGTLRGVLELDDRFSAQLRTAIGSLESSSDKFQKVGSNLQSLGAALAPVSIALVGAAGASLKFSSDFESAMTKVSTIAAESFENLASVKQAVLDMSVGVGTGPKALADALIVVESTGIKGAQALDILEMSAKASAAGLGETKEIARAITAAITAYGSENLSAAKAADILFAAVKAGGAEATEFAGSLGRVIGISAQVGVSFEEASAFIATFTRLGVDADEAVTALRGTLSTVLHPTRQSREALESVGISVEQLRKNIQEHGLTQAMIELVEATKGNMDALGSVIPNVRALAGILGSAGSQADAMREILDSLANSSGALEDAFHKTTDTAAFKWAAFKSQLEGVAISWGNALMPIAMQFMDFLKDILPYIEKAAHAFSALPKPVQEVAFGLGAIIAVGSPLLILFGSLVRAVGLAEVGITSLIGLFTAETAAVAVNTGAMAGNTAALIAETAAATAAGKALKFAEEEQLAFNFAVPMARDEMGKFLPRLWQAEQMLLPLSGNFEKTSVAIAETGATAAGTQGMWAKLVASLGGAGTAVTGLGESIVAAAAFIDAPMVAAAAVVGGFALAVIDLGNFGDEISTEFKLMGDAAKDVAAILKDTLVTSASLAKDAVTGLWDAIKEGAASDPRVQAGLSGLHDAFAGLLAITLKWVSELKDADMWIQSLSGHWSDMPKVPSAGPQPAPIGTTQNPNVVGGLGFSKTFIGIGGIVDDDTKSVNNLKDAVDDLNKSQAKLVTSAMAWASFMGSDYASKPLGVQEDYYDALDKVVRQFGSLKAAGLQSLEPVYKKLDVTVGKVHDLHQSFDDMISKTLKKLPGVFQLPKPTYFVEFKGEAKSFFETVQDGFRGYDIDFKDAQDELGFFSLAWRHQQESNERQDKEQHEARIKRLTEWRQSLSSTAAGFQQLAEISGGSMSDVARQIGTVIGASDLAGRAGDQMKAGFDSMSGSTKNVAAGLANMAAGAVAAVASIMQATQSTSRIVNVLGGALAGAAAGAAFASVAGPWGIAAGAAVGAIVGAFRDGHKKTRAEIESWVEDTFGGFDRLQEILIRLGREDLWVGLTQGSSEANVQASKDIKNLIDLMKKYGLSINDIGTPTEKFSDSLRSLSRDYDALRKSGFGDAQIAKAATNQIIELVEQAMRLKTALPDALQSMVDVLAGEWTKALKDGGKEADNVKTKLNEMLSVALETGQKIPAAFGDMAEELARTGGLTDDLMRKLLGLPAPDVVPWKDMQEAAEEFHISLDALGPAFQQGRLSDGAEDLAKKWHLLVDNGADVNAVIAGMSDKANEFVHNALKFGLEIPASMRPLLDAMAKTGKLTDEAGDKIEDLSGFKFAPDLPNMIEELVKAIRELVDKFKEAPGAIDKTGEAIRRLPNMPRYDFGGFAPGDNPTGDSPESTGGPGFGAAMRVGAYDASQFATISDTMGGSYSQPVEAVFKINDRELARAIIPALGTESRSLPVR